MFETLFNKDEKTRRQRTKFKIMLVMLEEILQGHEIISYIRRHHEYLEKDGCDITYKFHKKKITIQSGNKQIILEAYPTFEGFDEFIFQYQNITERVVYSELKGFSFTDNFVYSIEIDRTTTTEENKTTIKKNREDRAYLCDRMIYRNKSKEIEENTRGINFLWGEDTHYFIDGSDGFKYRNVYHPVFEGKSVTHPEFPLEPYIPFSEIHDVKQMSFYSKRNWEEPIGTPISKEDYLEKLKTYKQQLDLEAETEMLKLHLKDENI